jgi:hypothetical protein
MSEYIEWAVTTFGMIEDELGKEAAQEAWANRGDTVIDSYSRDLVAYWGPIITYIRDANQVRADSRDDNRAYGLNKKGYDA